MLCEKDQKYLRIDFVPEGSAAETQKAIQKVFQDGTLTGFETRRYTKSGHHEISGQVKRSHHERWEGKGYPDGLKGESIPLAGVLDNALKDHTIRKTLQNIGKNKIYISQ